MTNKTPLPPQSPCIPTPTPPFLLNSIGSTTKTPLIQPVYTRNSTTPLPPAPYPDNPRPPPPQAARSPFSSSPLQFALLRGRSFSDSWPGLLLFYGEYCDPTISLRGDQCLQGPTELLIWSSPPLSWPFSSFPAKTFCSWWASRTADLIRPGGHLTRWARGLLERTDTGH